MQSETHETLYKSLEDITAKVKTAVGKNDARTLMRLAEEHKHVMDKLDRAGLSQDTRLLQRVEETRRRICEIIVTIGRQRDELGRRLALFKKKKMISTAYAGNKK